MGWLDTIHSSITQRNGVSSVDATAVPDKKKTKNIHRSSSHQSSLCRCGGRECDLSVTLTLLSKGRFSANRCSTQLVHLESTSRKRDFSWLFPANWLLFFLSKLSIPDLQNCQLHICRNYKLLNSSKSAYFTDDYLPIFAKNETLFYFFYFFFEAFCIETPFCV